jgi:hypothetical protein
MGWFGSDDNQNDTDAKGGKMMLEWAMRKLKERQERKAREREEKRQEVEDEVRDALGEKKPKKKGLFG